MRPKLETGPLVLEGPEGAGSSAGCTVPRRPRHLALGSFGPPIANREIALVRDSLGVIARRLAELPQGAVVDALRAKANEYAGTVVRWQTAMPPADERARVSKEIILLHVEVAKAERAMAR